MMSGASPLEGGEELVVGALPTPLHVLDPDVGVGGVPLLHQFPVGRDGLFLPGQGLEAEGDRTVVVRAASRRASREEQQHHHQGQESRPHQLFTAPASMPP
jgi:hypothetical protein